jgi:thiamine-phosphate pyrophosphorylase
MPESTLLYYITDRKAFPGDESTRRRRLLDKVAEAATHGVNYIQLREKDLSARGLESLAREAMRIIRDQGLRTENGELKTALLVNSRTDVALAASADGVHLRSDDISPAEVGTVWKRGADTPDRKNLPRDPIIAISCHSPQEAAQAAANGASFAVFAPVFEKKNAPGTLPTGLEALRQACRARIPVLALGGVTLQNAGSCLKAGAAGIAAIRLFQENEIAAIVRELREA